MVSSQSERLGQTEQAMNDVLDKLKAAEATPEAALYVRTLWFVARSHYAELVFSTGQLVCSECGVWDLGQPVLWPCATFRRIAEAVGVTVEAVSHQ